MFLSCVTLVQPCTTGEFSSSLNFNPSIEMSVRVYAGRVGSFLFLARANNNRWYPLSLFLSLSIDGNFLLGSILFFSSPYRWNNTTRSALQREGERETSHRDPKSLFTSCPRLCAVLLVRATKGTKGRKMEETKTNEKRDMWQFPRVSLITLTSPTNYLSLPQLNYNNRWRFFRYQVTSCGMRLSGRKSCCDVMEPFLQSPGPSPARLDDGRLCHV